jgi:hypothetical protein
MELISPGDHVRAIGGKLNGSQNGYSLLSSVSIPNTFSLLITLRVEPKVIVVITYIMIFTKSYILFYFIFCSKHFLNHILFNNNKILDTQASVMITMPRHKIRIYDSVLLISEVQVKNQIFVIYNSQNMSTYILYVLTYNSMLFIKYLNIPQCVSCILFMCTNISYIKYQNYPDSYGTDLAETWFLINYSLHNLKPNLV